jgi:hypothetical protein
MSSNSAPILVFKDLDRFEKDSKPHVIVKLGYHVGRLAILCEQLTQLRILEAAQDLLALLPVTGHPNSPEVTIFNHNRRFLVPRTDFALRPLLAPWTTIRVLEIHVKHLQPCILGLPRPITPLVLENLEIVASSPEEEMVNSYGVHYLANHWITPALQTLTIVNVN